MDREGGMPWRHPSCKHPCHHLSLNTLPGEGRRTTGSLAAGRDVLPSNTATAKKIARGQRWYSQCLVVRVNDNISTNTGNKHDLGRSGKEHQAARMPKNSNDTIRWLRIQPACTARHLAHLSLTMRLHAQMDFWNAVAAWFGSCIPNWFLNFRYLLFARSHSSIMNCRVYDCADPRAVTSHLPILYKQVYHWTSPLGWFVISFFELFIMTKWWWLMVLIDLHSLHHHGDG